MQIEIIKSRRKTMALQFKKPDLLLVRVPLRTSHRKVEHFIAAHQAWISKQQQRFIEHPGLPDSVYAHDGFLWLVGNKYKISLSRGKRALMLGDDQTLYISHPTGDEVSVERQIKTWKRNHAESLFSKLLAEQHAEFPIKLPEYRLSLRQMRRQWGNCARDGLIKLNVALIRYPVECIRHVIWHELCHLKHFNHSQEFYRLLETVEPDWRTNKKLLENFSGKAQY